ncbi:MULTISPECIES: hypothetical protein [unclassified Micromonospora]|uniref:hypothetical protein n=1 Tax=unclassified Micromonospora TaxID=2617518 RepID=UPI003A8BE5E0
MTLPSEGHPLRVPSVIARLAECAALGGAVAVRVNHPDDVRAVESAVDLPVIALHKERAADRDLITPRWELVEALAAAGADVGAVEATGRGDLPVDALVARVYGQLDLPVMADVATVAEPAHLMIRVGRVGQPGQLRDVGAQPGRQRRHVALGELCQHPPVHLGDGVDRRSTSGAEVAAHRHWSEVTGMAQSWPLPVSRSCRGLPSWASCASTGTMRARSERTAASATQMIGA